MISSGSRSTSRRLKVRPHLLSASIMSYTDIPRNEKLPRRLPKRAAREAETAQESRGDTEESGDWGEI